MQRSFEETQIMPGERRVSPGDADVIATIGDPMLRDAMDRAMEIRGWYGDNEAFLAQAAGEIVSDLEIVAKTLRLHPEQSIAAMLSRMGYQEKLTTIERIRVMLDHIEANAMPDIPETATPVMLTGPRTIPDPDGLRAALVTVIGGLSKDGPIVGIAGGATGADQCWAEALIETETYFVMVVPNWAYPFYYDRVEDFTKIKESPFCLGFQYSVERPEEDNWRDLWRSQRWWTDNFKRNGDMIDRASETKGHHIVCAPVHPKVILEDRKITGGTADATRQMARKGVEQVIYVPTEDPDNIVWVSF